MLDWNEINKLSRDYATLATKTVSFEDNGMRYEADLRVIRNSDYNMARGATLRYFGGRDVYKIRKDGTRGRKLVICGARKGELGYAEQEAFKAETLAALGEDA